MNKWIIITSINSPNTVLEKFSRMKGWNLLVVGDKKTPDNWHLDNCTYLSPEQQMSLGYNILKYQPWNHYSRKNVGYLYAIEHGADIIWETDDDNIPMETWPNYLEESAVVRSLDTERDTANVYLNFGVEGIWPRGFPLQDIADATKLTCTAPMLTRVPVQQGLADNDPDVDAIYRLTKASLICFDKKAEPVALRKGTFCPFNSQNTAWYRSGFWGLLLFGSIPSRVTDIWRGYFVQRLLWEMDSQLLFLPPSVWQDRNVHDLIKDFKEEEMLYMSSKLLVEFLLEFKFADNNILEKFLVLVEALAEKKFIYSDDIKLANAWVEDLSRCGYKP